jgi:hypothetical protein
MLHDESTNETILLREILPCLSEVLQPSKVMGCTHHTSEPVRRNKLGILAFFLADTERATKEIPILLRKV